LQIPDGIALSVQRSLYAVATAMRCSHLPSEHPLSNRPRILQHPRTCSLLQSPVRSDRHRHDPMATLLGFGPFQRLRLRKPGFLGFASPDTFRLQGFTPSCRLTSSTASRPCFMPVTLVGFSFRAFPPRRAFGPFRNQSPSWRWHLNREFVKLPREPSAKDARLQGFTLCKDSPPSDMGLTTR
jgi:hypothetical protein